MLRGKQECADCHFLVKTTFVPPAERIVQIVGESDRSAARDGDFGWVREIDALSCYFGVWDEGHSSCDVSQRPVVIAGTDRRNFCFFWGHRPGMFLPAAKVLQEREARLHEARRDRRLTLWGLWIAAAALIANVGLTWSARGYWPF